MKHLLGFIIGVLLTMSPIADAAAAASPEYLINHAVQASTLNQPLGPMRQFVTQRAPTVNDDTTHGFTVGNFWIAGGRSWTAQRVTPAGQASWQINAAPGLPIDAGVAAGVTATPIAYGTFKLAGLYTGNALDVTRVSDGSVKTVGYLSTGDIDAATADAFCAGTTCGISTLYDNSGGGCNATQTIQANMPSWLPNAMVQTLRAISINTNPHAIAGTDTRFNAITPKYLNICSGFALTASNSTFFLAQQGSTIQENRQYWQTTSGSAGLLSNYLINAGASTDNLRLNTEGGGYCQMAPETGPSVLSMTWNGTVSRCTSNNRSGVGVTSTRTATTGGIIGSTSTLFPATYNAAAILLYPAALTAPQTAAINLALQIRTGIVPQSDTVVLDDGDSSTSGEGSLANANSGSYALSLINQPVTYQNMAIYGYSLCTPAGQGVLGLLQYNLPQTYNPYARNFIVTIMAGANDIRGSANAATIYACLQQYVAAVKAYGAANSLVGYNNIKVLVATEFLQCDILNNATFLPILQSYNGMIAANATVAQSAGGLGADGLIDYFGDPTIGAGVYTSSPLCTYTLSADATQHPNDVGMQYLGGVKAAAINSILAASP